MPGDDVEGGVLLPGGVELVGKLAVQPVLGGFLFVVEGRYGRLEVAGIGETVGADRAELGELVVALVELADVSSHWTGGESNAISIQVFVRYSLNGQG